MPAGPRNISSSDYTDFGLFNNFKGLENKFLKLLHQFDLLRGRRSLHRSNRPQVQRDAAIAKSVFH